MERLGQWLAGWSPMVLEHNTDMEQRVEAIESRLESLDTRFRKVEHELDQETRGTDGAR